MVKTREFSQEEIISRIKSEFGCSPEKLADLQQEDQLNDIRQLSIELQALLGLNGELEELIQSDTKDSTALKSIKNRIQERVVNVYEGFNTLFQTIPIIIDKIPGLDYGEEEGIKFFNKDGSLKIKFPYLLRSKDKRSNDEKALYGKRFREYRKKKHLKTYMEPVAICFVHCFRPTQMREAPDLDNFNIKGVIDLIVPLCLVDDAPEYLYSITSTWKYSKTPHSEVTVMPNSKLADFLADVEARRTNFLKNWRAKNNR